MYIIYDFVVNGWIVNGFYSGHGDNRQSDGIYYDNSCTYVFYIISCSGHDKIEDFQKNWVYFYLQH